MVTVLSRIYRRLLFWTQKEKLSAELTEELALHYRMMQTGAQIGDDECRRQMGNLTLAKEQSQDSWGFPSIENLLHDIRYSFRLLRRNPGFVCIAVASLALGIAGNIALFSIINNLLIRPLPFEDPARLVRITQLFPKAIFENFQRYSRTLDIAFVSPGSEFNLTGNGPASRVTGSETSANLFSILGVGMARGRAFASSENQPPKDGVVILSQTLWETQFHSDPNVLGSVVTLNGLNRQVIGIAPPGFAFPSRKVQLWIPTRIDPRNTADYWGGAFVPLVARLKPGMRIEQAQNEIHSLAAHVWTFFPWPMPRRWNSDSTVISLQSDLVGETRSKLFILLGAVGVLLLVACANVASLLLARAASRRKEIAMRAALGAGTFRIIRQLLTESVLLALTAGVVGVSLGVASITLFRSLVPADTPGMDHITVDWRVCLFALSLSVVTGLFFGIAPAISIAKLDLIEAMRTGNQRSTTKTWIFVRSCLIGAEIALTVSLVAGAGLLMKSLYGLSNTNPGFNSQRILTVKISPNDSFCPKREACLAFYNRLVAQTRASSGVTEAAAANTLPLDGELPALASDVENHPRTADFPAPMLWTGAVTPTYFRLMQIPLLAGRFFTDADGPSAPPVIVISSSTARRFWPRETPLGKHIRKVGEANWRTVVGVVADVKQFNLANHSPGSISGAMYLPYAQSLDTDDRIPVVMNLIAKTSAPSAQVGAQLRQLAINADPNVPIGPVMPLADVVSDSLSGYRSSTWMFLSFAIAALVLAAIGLYGLISYSVAQRTYEISVRMAIGARAASILRMLLRQSLRIALSGVVAGIVLSLLLTQVLSSMLVGITATDPSIFLLVALVVFIVVIASSSLPAWRASRIDPIRTLRAE